MQTVIDGKPEALGPDGRLISAIGIFHPASDPTWPLMAPRSRLYGFGVDSCAIASVNSFITRGRLRGHSRPITRPLYGANDQAFKSSDVNVAQPNGRC
jgi:hypothetical protein